MQLVQASQKQSSTDMAYIRFKDSKGVIHSVPEGEPYKRGPDWVEIDPSYDDEQVFNDSVGKLAKFVGITADEAITRLAKVLNIPKCPNCQKRSLILREMGRIGWIETARRLKATFKKDTN